MKIIKQRDTARSWNWTLLIDGQPMNLDGCTVSLHLKPPSGAVVTRACTIVDAAGGQVSYSPVDADVATAQTWTYELQVTYSNGKKLTAPNQENLKLKVMADLA